MASAVKNNTLRNGEHGFSLIEMLVMMAILSAITTGTIMMTEHYNAERNTKRFHRNANQIAEFVADELTYALSCQNTFGTVALNPTATIALTNIRDSLNQARYSVTGSYANGTVQLASVIATDYVDVSGNQGKMTLSLGFRATQSVYGDQEIRRQIEIRTVKAGANLTSCQAKALYPDHHWQIAANGADIYKVGKVGIYTNAPQAALDVKGGFIHGQLECRKVYGTHTFPGRSLAACNADEYVISGGACCTDPAVDPLGGGFVHYSGPTADMSGWETDCYISDPGVLADTTGAMSFAVCCKK